MVWDRYRQEHDLTSRGWVKGSFSGMGRDKTEVDPHADSVETWEERMHQASGWSKQDIAYNRIWKSPDYSEEELKRLHEAFTKDLRDKSR